MSSWFNTKIIGILLWNILHYAIWHLPLFELSYILHTILFGHKNLSKSYTFCKIKCLSVVSIESCIISLPYSTSFRATDKRIIKYCKFVWAVTTYFTRTFSWFYAHLIVSFLAIVSMLLRVPRDNMKT